MTLIVRAPARLHLGFIDLHGGCGRLFGSLGVALETPAYLLEASIVDRTEAHGPSADVVLDVLARLGTDQVGLSVLVREAIPRHRGFGSGTQLELAVAFILSKLVGDGAPVREMARRTTRGQRSGIGIATFERGGFVVDAGSAAGESRGDREMPPVIFQHPVPADWRFVILTPRGRLGLNGVREERVFAELPLMSEEKVGRISRLTLMKILPGLLTDDIQAFGDGISEIQELVGNHFAPYQGGVYATETGRRAVELALKLGASGVGQSSWGPTVFALVRGEDHARDLAEEIKASLGGESEAVFHTRASNCGVAWRTDP
jgi:beta-ribofuranosylaminobenzene 5'-phosphate synthase